jgi:hypothetical protein
MDKVIELTTKIKSDRITVLSLALTRVEKIGKTITVLNLHQEKRTVRKDLSAPNFTSR